MRYLVLGKWKKSNIPTVWSTWDNREQAEHDCQLIHNDSNVAYAFVAEQTEFQPSDKDKR